MTLLHRGGGRGLDDAALGKALGTASHALMAGQNYLDRVAEQVRRATSMLRSSARPGGTADRRHRGRSCGRRAIATHSRRVNRAMFGSVAESAALLSIPVLLVRRPSRGLSVCQQPSGGSRLRTDSLND
jgi:hypothetical protein